MPVASQRDVWDRLAPQFNGAYVVDASLLSFAGLDLPAGAGLISQTIQVSYQQNISRVFELGTVYQYYIQGRAQGTANLARVLGPRPLIFAFYKTYGNACNAAVNTITLSMQAGCYSAADLQAQANLRFLWLTGVVIQNLTFSTQAEQMQLNEQSSLMFVALIPEAGAA
jgi:hypothetical protein